MLDIQVTNKKQIRTYYVVDTHIRNAICMFAYDEETAITKILELKESYEELYSKNGVDVHEAFNNLFVIEIDQTVAEYSLTELNMNSYLITDIKYYYYTYSSDAYKGKSGFIINPISEKDLLDYLQKNKLMRLLRVIDKKILKCIKRMLSFKRTFCLRYGYKIIYILISPEYYKWAQEEGSDN